MSAVVRGPAMTADPMPPLDAEWLEADGMGGFACGTVSGEPTRRYHALLRTATLPPAGRIVLVNGVDAWIETDGGRFALSTQRHLPDLVEPRGFERIAAFDHEPWPTWTFALPDGSEVTQEILVARAACETVLRWRRRAGDGPARLVVRPLLSGRDQHGIHRENDAFAFDVRAAVAGSVSFRPYPDLPAVAILSNGDYRHAPAWHRAFLYLVERARGMDDVEDLAAPGTFTFDLAAADALMVLRAGDGVFVDPAAHATALVEGERARRSTFADPLDRAAESYIVRRGHDRTIIAGFPWFTDWGRDTFISLRGLCTARGRHDVARDILVGWARQVSDGMLPNVFSDAADVPQYNTVDAPLWYVVAAHEHIEAGDPAPAIRTTIETAVRQILQGYANGTRYGIRADADGLLAAGVPTEQLTWMDGKIGDYVVTPRIGKPVEIQALWINALALAGPDFAGLFERARASFEARFWNEETGCLFDVVDDGHEPGRTDPAIRPNQIFAVGGLPLALLEGERARRVVEVVERELLTPLGLRSLERSHPAYRPRYAGDLRQRDTAYHQGTVWPWLMGPFVEAWLRVHGHTPERRAEARARFLQPLLDHLEVAGLGHVSEIADAELPHTPQGCPFQAWSMGELIRIRRMLA